MKFFITTPIYYVNSKPHVGTLYSTLLADTLARYAKLAGKRVFFLTGTDEHGQKIEQRARELGIDPVELADRMSQSFKEIWKTYNISNDFFIRTTEEFHVKAVQKFIERMVENGDVYKTKYRGKYCVPCETFVPGDEERCPHCGRELIEIEEENYFFRLSAYEQALLDFYEENPEFVYPKERMNELLAMVKGGLRDVSISRKSVSHGIPFPGDEEQTVYVWIDALLNYATGVGFGRDDPLSTQMFENWFPPDLQVMAKDILKFHGVYWPAMLMSAGLPLPKKLLVHGYVLSGDQKMSKSRGNTISPELLAKNYGVDRVRYYLMRTISVGKDGSFSEAELVERTNADLANNLGNLLSRISALVVKHDLTELSIPEKAVEVADVKLREAVREAVREGLEHAKGLELNKAVATFWNGFSLVNQYMQETRPWELGNNRERLSEVLFSALRAVEALTLAVWPVIPGTSERILSAIGSELRPEDGVEDRLRRWELSKRYKVVERLRLFNKVEVTRTEVEETAEGEKGSEPKYAAFDEFLKVEMCVGKIEEAVPVEGSKKLLKLTVNFGPAGRRTVVSGVAQYFSPEYLTGKSAIFVTNLKPRKIFGIQSEAMLLVASDDSGMRLSTVDGDVKPGTRIG